MIKVAGCIVAMILVVIGVPIVIDSVESVDEDLTVFVLMGQSNSAHNYNYGGNLAIVREDVPLIPENKAYYFGMSAPTSKEASNGRWRDMIDASYMHSMVRDGEWAIYSLEPSLGQTFYDYTGKKCLIINVGVGGISIDTLLPGGDTYEYATLMIDTALSRIPSNYRIDMGCIFWLQGERNKNSEIDWYKEKFTEVWDNFRSMYGFESIVISQTRAQNGGNATIAQAELAGSNGVYMGTTLSQTFTLENGLMYSDDVHYSQKGKDLIGSALMTYYCENLYESPSKSPMKMILELMPLLMAFSGIALIAYTVISKK